MVRSQKSQGISRREKRHRKNYLPGVMYEFVIDQVFILREFSMFENQEKFNVVTPWYRPSISKKSSSFFGGPKVLNFQPLPTTAPGPNAPLAAAAASPTARA